MSICSRAWILWHASQDGHMQTREQDGPSLWICADQYVTLQDRAPRRGSQDVAADAYAKTDLISCAPRTHAFSRTLPLLQAMPAAVPERPALLSATAVLEDLEGVSSQPRATSMVHAGAASEARATQAQSGRTTNRDGGAKALNSFMSRFMGGSSDEEKDEDPVEPQAARPNHSEAGPAKSQVGRKVQIVPAASVPRCGSNGSGATAGVANGGLVDGGRAAEQGGRSMLPKSRADDILASKPKASAQQLLASLDD